MEPLRSCSISRKTLNTENAGHLTAVCRRCIELVGKGLFKAPLKAPGEHPGWSFFSGVTWRPLYIRPSVEKVYRFLLAFPHNYVPTSSGPSSSFTSASQFLSAPCPTPQSPRKPSDLGVLSSSWLLAPRSKHCVRSEPPSSVLFGRVTGATVRRSRFLRPGRSCVKIMANENQLFA